MFLSVLVYLGLCASFIGCACLLKPIRLIRVHTRRHALRLLGVGLLLLSVGLALPARQTRVEPLRSRLDEFAPVYEFSERHSIRIRAPKERVDRAIKQVRADEVFLFRTLVWVRRLGRTEGESILNPPPGKPLLEVATDTSFLLLADDPGRETVIGTAVVVPPDVRFETTPTPEDYKALRRPGFAVAAMNFLIHEDRPGECTLTTETRVHATDAPTRRRFALYWRLIHPGSALIRRMWLRAIKRRAEGPA